jgi:hypothetical protein
MNQPDESLSSDRIDYVPDAGQTTEEIMAELGTAQMTAQEILGDVPALTPAPRQRGLAGWRAGYTKKHNRGISKEKRVMRKKSQRMNRQRRS